VARRLAELTERLARIEASLARVPGSGASDGVS
jgi:hypothetical protein